jgi:hypothetical protein
MLETMIDKECFYPKRPSIAPSILICHVCRNLARRETLAQRGELLYKLHGVTGKARRENVAGQCQAKQKHNIGFRYMRPPQVLEEQGMALEEPDYWVDQVCEQDGKAKDNDDRARDYAIATTTANKRIVSSTFAVRRSGNDIVFQDRNRAATIALRCSPAFV